MIKKVVCIFVVLAVLLTFLSGCGKQIETVTVDNETATADFNSYRKEIISIMDKSGVKYKLNDINLSKESKNQNKPFMFFGIALETENNEAIVVSLMALNKVESFTISIDIKRKTLDDCKLNIRDYPYVRDIFNLVSDIQVSAFTCNHLIRSSRRGMDEKFKDYPDTFNISENKYFSRDKTHTWYLQYQITQQTSAKITEFDESLIFKGNLSARGK